MAEQGAILDGPYVCPHRYRDPCACKKPQRFLYERAAADLGLSLTGAFVIGDTADDMEAARRIAGVGCLVWPGAEEPDTAADFVGADLATIVGFVLDRSAA